MKHCFYLFLILIMLGCENNYEDIYRYSKVISQPKDYPVYLDMSEIGKIQVKSGLPLVAPFKIISNDKYYFVGDIYKGIHVYEKRAGTTSYLCFIECRYIKDFEVAGNRLFCNNFVDLVVLDISNPLQINILHRQKNYFNRFTSYAEYWNIPSVNGKGIIAGTERHVLTGKVTDKQPSLDFSEYDKLYDNLTTKVIPNSWFSNHPGNDKPYIGMVRMGSDEVYTNGSYNSWGICTFLSGSFSVKEEDLQASPRWKYLPPIYYLDAYPGRMFVEDSLVYIFGNGHNHGYIDCLLPNSINPSSYHMYFPDFVPLDITYVQKLQAFFVLSGQSVWGAFKSSDPSYGYMERYKDFQVATDAVSIFKSGNNLITIGSKLSVYFPSINELKLLKEYPDISGSCSLKSGDILAVANERGLFLYDISDLENIKLIP